MNDRPFGDRHGPTPDEMRHLFTVRPVDPELERAATERAVQAAEESARAAAWIDAHSGPATSGNAPTLNDPGEKFTPGVNGPAGLRDRLANALRANACNGDCGSTEEACARKRIQPCVWEHGVLTEVLGTPEVIADVALAALRPELDALAALRQVARGYCPHCGRGDAGITTDQWEQQRQRTDQAETAIARVRRLADGWVKADPPPLGTPVSRWWDKRLIELLAALDEPTASPAATQATQATQATDDYEQTTGHQITCAAGFADTCTCNPKEN
jgi:hypothetical protein